ncbi:MAG: hypothetical protein ABWZ66_09480 [Pyrinomonadaceae bacterium]
MLTASGKFIEIFLIKGGNPRFTTAAIAGVAAAMNIVHAKITIARAAKAIVPAASLNVRETISGAAGVLVIV